MEITKGENANLADMEPRCPKCGSTQVIQVWRLKDGFSVSCYGCGAIFKTPEESHHAQFFRSPAPTPPLDVPSVEEIIKLLGNGWKGFKLGDMEDLMFVVGQIRLAIQKFHSLRRHIASPAPRSSRTYGDLPGSIRNMVEPHEWDNKNISEQRDYALDMVEFLERELGNFRRNQAHAASPAQPEKRDALLGKVVRVENDRFNGFGYATHDSGPRKRVIGVMLENGNTWEYDAETVRSATPEEIKQAPRVVQAWAAPPQSGKEGQ